jgi:hypothetical protein
MVGECHGYPIMQDMLTVDEEVVDEDNSKDDMADDIDSVIS